MLLEKVNNDTSWHGDDQAVAPVMATPAALAATAKAAGFVVGAGAVTGAAYAAYRTATGSPELEAQA